MARKPAHPNLIAAWIAASIAMLLALALLAVPASANVTISSFAAPYANAGAGQSSGYSQNMSFTYNPGGTHGGAGDDLRRLAIDYPAGLVGNPNAITAANRCNTPDYNGGSAGTGVPGDVTASSGSPDYSSCPASSIVGTISTNVDARATVLFIPVDCNITLTGSIYLLRNRPNANPEVPTYLGIHVSGSAGGICALGGTSTMDMTARITLRPTDQGLRVIVIDDLPRTAQTGVGTAQVRINSINQSINATAPSGQPFLKNPTRCDAWTSVAYAAAWDSNSNLNADVYAPVGNDHVSNSVNQTPTCTSLATFNPGFTLTPTTTQAGQPTGMSAVLTNAWAVPQPANVKRVDMTFPVGYQINPEIGDKVGTTGCTTAQFNEANPDVAPTCPAATQVGTVTILTPMITPSVTGQVYLGQPLDSGANRYRLMVYASNGASVKFEARATVAANGQVTVTFGDAAVVGKSLPQFPWTSFALDFFGGADAMLTNPQVCGTYTVNTSITPWTSPNQAAVPVSDDLSVTAGPNAGGCNFDAFNPGFSASVSDTGASKHPNLTLTATRSDRQDNIEDMTFRLPDGFAGSVNNVVATCSAVDAAAAACTSASQLGTVAVAVGSGTGTVTLNGTVHLNPALSSELAKISIQVPVAVGPFDLGDVVMYSTMTLNSGSNLSVSAVTLNLPQMLEGIPVRYRSVALTLNGIADQGTGSTADDKPFLQNPSACNPLQYQATFVSANEAPASSVSTVVKNYTGQTITNCTQPFNPTITVTPTTTAAATPTGLGVTINVPQTTVGVTTSTVQHSTVKRVQLQMPAGMYINPGFANGLTACSTANIDAGGAACAASSEVGSVSLTTPLIAGTQTGKVYIETPGGTPATRYKLAVVVNVPSGYLVIRGSTSTTCPTFRSRPSR
ncbi:MAG: hypothetical protein HZB14_06760 [Actinobacteria bacterium]|nr:hypothetical protein [Actinomycetota bacterium]